MYHLIQNLGGPAGLSLISLCLFGVVFTGALVWACRLKTPFLKAMSSLPLDEAEASRPGFGKEFLELGENRHLLSPPSPPPAAEERVPEGRERRCLSAGDPL